MARQGMTLTKHMAIEPRQHDLWGIDLGEGPKRFDIAFGAAVFVVWGALMILCFGAPQPASLMLYILPPGLLLKFGTTENKVQERRKNVTQWIIRLRFALVSHRPIVNLGRKEASTVSYLPVSYRFQTQALKHLLFPWQKVPEWHDVGDATDRLDLPVGSPILLRQKGRLYGNDYMGHLLTKAQAKAGRKGRQE
jgi:hypothetical protein